MYSKLNINLSADQNIEIDNLLEDLNSIDEKIEVSPFPIIFLRNDEPVVKYEVECAAHLLCKIFERFNNNYCFRIIEMKLVDVERESNLYWIVVEWIPTSELPF